MNLENYWNDNILKKRSILNNYLKLKNSNLKGKIEKTGHKKIFIFLYIIMDYYKCN